MIPFAVLIQYRSVMDKQNPHISCIAFMNECGHSKIQFRFMFKKLGFKPDFVYKIKKN